MNYKYLRFIITVICILVIILLILYPLPLKHIIKNTPNPQILYEPNENAVVEEKYTLYTGSAEESTSSSQKIKRKINNLTVDHDDIDDDLSSNLSSFQNDDTFQIAANKNNESQKYLIVWINGGAFLVSDKRTAYGVLNELSKKFTNNYDILVFDYPVRFMNTVKDALIHINEIILQVYMKKTYKHVFCIGMSAGSLLMGAYQQKEINEKIAESMGVPQIRIKFQAMIGLCGLYDNAFNSKLLSDAFRWYIMSGTPHPEYYSCYNLPDTPKLVISAKKEFLFTQSYKYVIYEANCESKFYENPQLNHSFPLNVKLPETVDMINRIVKFIVKYS